jgi:hypothetical protein
MTSRSALDLLALALDQAPSERAQFVKNQANGDAGLLATVHQLLQAHARCEQFLEPTPNQNGVNERCGPNYFGAVSADRMYRTRWYG